jgi:hypothetical protein
VLRSLTLQVPGLVFEMKDEPEFKAGIRDGQVDAMPVSEVDGPCEVGVLVTVKYAPDLVMGTPAPFPRVASFSSLRFNCSLHELQGAASMRVDLDQYSVAVLAAPVREVELLGAKALDEYEQIEQNCVS